MLVELSAAAVGALTKLSRRAPLVVAAAAAVMAVMIVLRKPSHKLDREVIKKGREVPPRMPAPPIIGNLIPFGIDSAGFAAKGHAVYGDVFATTVLSHNFVFLNGKPNITRFMTASTRELSFSKAYEVFLGALLGHEEFTDTGKDVFAALTSSRIDAMTPALLDVTRRHIARRMQGSGGGVIDAGVFFNELVAVMSVTMVCGADFGLEHGPEFARLLHIFESDLSVFGNFLPFETPSMRRRKAARLAMYDLVIQHARRRIAKLKNTSMSAADDYFDRLVHASYYRRSDRESEAENARIASEFENDVAVVDLERLSDEERVTKVASAAFGLIFAAHTNTAASSMAHLGEVLRRPDCVEMLRRDFDEHLGADPIATFEAYLARVNAAPRDKPKEASPFMQMRDSHRILSETMRVYSRGGLWRRAMEDVELENGMVIPKGSFVTVTGHLVATNPALYGADGDRWDPERLTRPAGRRLAGDEVGQFGGKLDDLQSPLVRAADMQMAAFGAGRHLCPGRFLAYRIITQMTAQLLRGHDLEIEEAFSRWWIVPLGGTSRPVGSFRLRWTPRG
ncbi:hypothetical protein HK105_204160 [Polyrhizophydium stewartii]|uniref:Cytochrome P450 n=1 Tax=Polyrhizophydium stewartii TaxID=2732419 RepID=A0ABR4NA63_9FUNG|nr:Lanosterol 14-alpha-demethylase [Polyrhizophydium stewartii]